MNQYITGAIIKRLRENRGLTQPQLAAKINVSDKAVSKCYITATGTDCSKRLCAELSHINT